MSCSNQPSRKAEPVGFGILIAQVGDNLVGVRILIAQVKSDMLDLERLQRSQNNDISGVIIQRRGTKCTETSLKAKRTKVNTC